MVYQLSKIGRRLTWPQWEKVGGCGLSHLSQMEATVKLNLPQAHWTNITLGEIEDACAVAGRELARFAIEHLNRPEWTQPYKSEGR